MWRFLYISISILYIIYIYNYKSMYIRDIYIYILIFPHTLCHLDLLLRLKAYMLINCPYTKFT